MTPVPVRSASIPSELFGSVPRDVRLTPGGIALAVLDVALFAGAPAAAIWMSLAYARETATGRPAFPILLIPLAALSLLASGWVIARGLRQQWILLSEGRAALARVTTLKKVRSDKGTRYKVSYEFQTLSGARRTSRCETGRTPPAVGSVVPVIYHRDDPAWSAIYPLQLVRTVSTPAPSRAALAGPGPTPRGSRC